MHDNDNGDGDDDDDLCGHLKFLLAQLHACETSRYLNVHSMGLQPPRLEAVMGSFIFSLGKSL